MIEGISLNRTAVLRRLPLALVAVAAFLALIVGLFQFAETARYGDLIRMARGAAYSNGVSASVMTVAMPNLEAIVTERVCRREIVMAGMRLLLREVDRRSLEQDDAAWRETPGFAETYLRHGIDCLPQEGDLWLRQAMIRNLLALSPAEIATLFNTSQALAPGMLISTRN